MKRSIKLAVVAALALGATSAFATNGTNMIGYGAKSRAMGGTGISNFQGAESAFANPALITKSEKNTEITIGATLLMPSVSFEANAAANGLLSGGAIAVASDDSSTAGDGMIPAVAAINKVNDNFAWGIALYGVGGMGVDYRTTTPTSAITAGGINDSLLLMRASIPFAYETNGFSVGVAPVIEYGSLAIAGVTTDIAVGYEIGAAYEISGFSVGLDYKSAVTHEFKNTFNSEIDPATGRPSTTKTQSKLDTPAVVGLGLSYNFGENTIAFDYKNIAYGSAQGLEDFGWDNQNVFALGYEYATTSWAARLGYNYGASPLPGDLAVPTDFVEFGQITGSLMQFPAVTESHFTIGGSYNVSETMSVDAAFMYATGSQTEDLSNAGAPGAEITATNNQTALSVALNYAF